MDGKIRQYRLKLIDLFDLFIEKVPCLKYLFQVTVGLIYIFLYNYAITFSCFKKYQKNPTRKYETIEKNSPKFAPYI